MLNLSLVSEYPFAREIATGVCYGIAMASVLHGNQRGSATIRCVIVGAGGALLLAAIESSQNRSPDWEWVISHGWILAGLVCFCHSIENLRHRIGDDTAASRQFGISDLLVLTTAVALFTSAVQRTSLVDRDPVFWAGMIGIGVVVPCCVVSLRLSFSARSLLQCASAFAGLTVVVMTLAWADSTIVQPGRITNVEAVTRYGCVIAAMMLPRVLFQIVAMMYRFEIHPLPSLDDQPLLSLDDQVCPSLEHHASYETSSVPFAPARAVDAVAVKQTQPAFRLFT